MVSNALDYKLKEPISLLFFKGAVYQFTYNEKKKFTQSQLGLIVDFPSQNDLDYCKAISILVAPPGMKVLEYDIEKPHEEYISEGWSPQYVGIAPERPQNVNMNMRGERRQYGLKHHLTSTVHASMGDTLNSLVTEISNQNDDFRLWDKAQAIVLLSRTRIGSDIIFVGDKTQTINALYVLIKNNTVDKLYGVCY